MTPLYAICTALATLAGVALGYFFGRLDVDELTQSAYDEGVDDGLERGWDKGYARGKFDERDRQPDTQRSPRDIGPLN